MALGHSRSDFEADKKGDAGNKQDEGGAAMSWIPGWDSIIGTGWWSGFYFWAGIVALISLGVFEIASHRYSDRKDELTAIEQTDIQRRHDEDMARVQHDTAQANERGSQLERDAANARLETEKLKQTVAWRTIPAVAVAALRATLVANPGAVNLRYTDGDPEALYLAIQFSKILADAHWQVAPGSLKLANAIVFGLAIPADASGDGNTLRAAFGAAHIEFSPDPLPPMGAAFNVATIAGAPTLMIGSRPPIEIAP